VNVNKLFFQTVTCFVLLCASVAWSAPTQQLIEKSANDDRDYRYLELPNKLKVLLISDPSAPKAAASLDVNVGSGEDPEGRAGLAHFLEHMLFLGTKKYPKVGEYHEFINAHGGGHNAYTSLEHTNYFFDIAPDSLDEALDRFAQFFTSPLFDAEYVERERNAVHSEYRAKFKDEFRRSWDVYREISNPDNKTARFSVGSQETLADRVNADGTKSHVRDDLLKFYKAYYSANIMSLAVLGTQPLDQLEKMVRQKFSAIPNANVKLSQDQVSFFNESFVPSMVYIKPLQNRRDLSIIFPIPVFEDYYHEKPVTYISFMLGHEGKDSLFYALRQKGWVESLSAGAGVSNREGALFHISLELTSDGYKNIDPIITHIYQAIARLKDDGIERWRYNEQSVVSQLNFRFQEKGDAMSYVSALSNNLHYYDVEDVIRGAVLMDRYDEALIKNFASYLRPDNAVIEVSAKDVPVNKTSQYYGTEYSVVEVPKKNIQAWGGASVNAKILSPLPNEFVAKQLKIKRRSAKQKDIPVRIKEMPNLRVWHLQDDSYKVPRGGVYIYARSIESVKSLMGGVLTDLLVEMLKHELNEYSYSASLAGLNLNVYKRSRGVGLELSGYSDKQGLLLKRALDGVVAPAFKEKDFNNIKAEMIRRLENQDKIAPYRQLLQSLAVPMLQNAYEREMNLAQLKKITLPELQHFTRKWLQSLNVDVFVHGNFNQSDAQKLGVLIESKLSLAGKRHYDPQALIVRMSDLKKPIFFPMEVDHSDVAVLRYYQGKDTSTATEALVRLAGQVISAEFFHQLRTEQQLGYVVFAGSRPMVHVPGLMFVVQSPEYSAADISSRIDEFLRRYMPVLNKMPEEEFQKHKKALIDELAEEPKNLAEQGARFWHDIALRRLSFNSRQDLIDELKKVDKQSFSHFFEAAYLKPLVQPINLVSESSDKKLQWSYFKQFDVSRDMREFKKRKQFFILK